MWRRSPLELSDLHHPPWDYGIIFALWLRMHSTEWRMWLYSCIAVATGLFRGGSCCVCLYLVELPEDELQLQLLFGVARLVHVLLYHRLTFLWQDLDQGSVVVVIIVDNIMNGGGGGGVNLTKK